MLKPRFKMYQEVVLVCESVKGDLLCESESTRVRKGQEGVIVLVNVTTGVPYIGYVVEFFDKHGETIAVSSVKESDIAALPDGRSDVKVVKPRKNRSKSRAA